MRIAVIINSFIDSTLFSNFRAINCSFRVLWNLSMGDKQLGFLIVIMWRLILNKSQYFLRRKFLNSEPDRLLFSSRIHFISNWPPQRKVIELVQFHLKFLNNKIEFLAEVWTVSPSLMSCFCCLPNLSFRISSASSDDKSSSTCGKMDTSSSSGSS